MPLPHKALQSLSKGCLLSAIALAAIPTAQTARAQIPTSHNLTVEVTGLSSSDGQVCLSIFENSQGFPDSEEAVFSRQCLPAATAEASESEDSSPAEIPADLSATFEGLESGTYAVAVYHDENGDGQLNRGNFLGIPEEGFGFSRNPIIENRRPEFHEAGIFVFGDNTTTQIELIYY